MKGQKSSCQHPGVSAWSCTLPLRRYGSLLLKPGTLPAPYIRQRACAWLLDVEMQHAQHEKPSRMRWMSSGVRAFVALFCPYTPAGTHAASDGSRSKALPASLVPHP